VGQDAATDEREPANSTKPAERRTARRGGGEGEQGGGGDGDNVVG